jgi:hypothetical protein
VDNGKLAKLSQDLVGYEPTKDRADEEHACNDNHESACCKIGFKGEGQ